MISFGGYDTIRDAFLVGSLQGNFFASFVVGWMTATASIELANVTRADYHRSRPWPRTHSTPFGMSWRRNATDSRRRMMMTSGEGVKALFNGAGANVLRSVAGACALSLYDK